MPLRAGTKIDSYEVLGLLGKGGMGEVYRARDHVLKREVAIKVLPTSFSQDSERLWRFEQEAQATAALNHPNILAIHQFGTFNGAPYLVSELLEGETLRQLLRRPLSIRKAVDCGVQTAHGLAAAHEKGIVHRDLKPENLFVTKTGRIKILDFGLAKLTPIRSNLENWEAARDQGTNPGMVMGTAGYMAPEQVRGESVDHRADFFAFGTILYEMLAGKRAFAKRTWTETMTAILNEEPAQISRALPQPLLRVMRRCLEKNPEQRFQSASDLAFALEPLCGDVETHKARSVFQQLRTVRPLYISMGLLTSLLAVAFFTWRSSRIPSKSSNAEGITVKHSSDSSKGAAPYSICNIDVGTNWSWTSPGPPQTVFSVDGQIVGKVALDGQPHEPLPFSCQPGEHNFTFQFNFGADSHNCSGSFFVAKAIKYNPVIHMTHGIAACSLVAAPRDAK